jgi:hypothetical protein
MTLVYTLSEAIDEGLRETGNGETRSVIRWLQMNRRPALDDNSLIIEAEGLGNLIRAHRKKNVPHTPNGFIRNLCFDFGLSALELDEQISVPKDAHDLVYGPCEWPELNNATVDDLDKHIALLEAQAADMQFKAANYRQLRQAAAQVVPDRTDIPLHELRAILRKRSGAAPI